MAAHPEWKDLVSRYELVASQARPDWGESKEQLDLKSQIDSVAGKINSYLRELEEIGCEFKDFDKGLVISTAASRDARSCGAGSRARTHRPLARAGGGICGAATAPRSAESHVRASGCSSISSASSPGWAAGWP